MASPPTTPPSRDPEDAAEYRFKTNGTACEWGESYRPGSYHPVHLGDVLQDRYRIIRKLGYGSFSTTWLAVDLRSDCLVALKITVASLDKEVTNQTMAIHKTLPQTEPQPIVSLRDVFELTGPNGRHACFVLEPMGPHISALLQRRPEFQNRDLEPWERRPRFPKQLAQRVLRDTLLGLRLLHKHGIVHGDLHPGNILANIQPLGETLNNATVESKLQQLPSQGNLLQRRDGRSDPWAPSYLLEPAPLQDQVSFDLDPVVKVADLGAAFFEDQPPAAVVTPVALRAPETILRDGLRLGMGIDIWAFGCLAFELLTGRALFVRLEALEGCEEFDEETNDEHLVQFSEVLGPLPEELASRWRRRDRYYGPDGKRLDVATGGGHGSEGSGTDDDSDSETSQRSSFSLADPGTFASLEEQVREHKPEGMGEEEVEEVSQLLRWILEYDASKRPSADAILRHPWFSSERVHGH